MTAPEAALRAARAEAVALADALARELAGIVEAAESVATDDEHDPEGATIAFERAQVAALLDRARDDLAALDAALARAAEGRYGRCDRCGGPIGAERLAARPAATLCIACAGSSRPR